MRLLRDAAAVAGLDDPGLRDLIGLKIMDMAPDGDWDADRHGHFIVAEPGDRVDALEAVLGCPILDRGDGCPPGFEDLVAHPRHYELVYIANDGGFGICLFVPKTGVDAELLAFCAAHAGPGGAEVVIPA